MQCKQYINRFCCFFVLILCREKLGRVSSYLNKKSKNKNNKECMIQTILHNTLLLRKKNCVFYICLFRKKKKRTKKNVKQSLKYVK
jgi:hypothetical protein